MVLKTMQAKIAALLLAQFALGLTVHAADLAAGKSVVDKYCAGCHGTGVLDAPKIGNADDWAPRIKQGRDLVVEHAIKGFNKMPPKGGNLALTDEQIGNAVDYLFSAAKAGGASADKKAVAPAAQAKPAAKAKAAPAPAPKPVQRGLSSANKFNRLMKSQAEWNPPQSEDGIHDPENEGTYALQPPKEAFANLPNNSFGDHVNWVKALEEGAINPRADRLDETKKPFVMDLNIVREVKGSMPNVVYPHKQHTAWLDCSNCHPAIFIPKKGANPISMATILMGEKCGVCHGKVAFPVSECRRCHSQTKSR